MNILLGNTADEYIAAANQGYANAKNFVSDTDAKAGGSDNPWAAALAAALSVFAPKQPVYAPPPPAAPKASAAPYLVAGGATLLALVLLK